MVGDADEDCWELEVQAGLRESSCCCRNFGIKMLIGY